MTEKCNIIVLWITPSHLNNYTVVMKSWKWQWNYFLINNYNVLSLIFDFLTRFIMQDENSRFQIVSFKFLTLPQSTMKTLNSSYSVLFKACVSHVDLWQYFCCLTKTPSKSKATKKRFSFGFFFCLVSFVFFFFLKQIYKSTIQLPWKNNRILTLLKKNPPQFFWFFRTIGHSCYSLTSLSFSSQKGGDSSEYDSKV